LINTRTLQHFIDITFSTSFPANCGYNVNGQNKKYQDVKTDAGEKIWCNEKKSIEATVTATSDVSGKTLTSDDCADAIVDLIACSSDNNLQILHDIPSNSSIKRSEIQRRSPVNTKSGNPPESYLSNFEGNSPPGPITHAPNTHYFSVAGEAAEAGATPYSVLFDGNRGDPVMLAYKLIKANMQGIDINKRLLRNRRTKLGMKFTKPTLSILLALSVLNCSSWRSSKDHLLLIQCCCRRKPKLN
jgi:hypothetical protein